MGSMMNWAGRVLPPLLAIALIAAGNPASAPGSPSQRATGSVPAIQRLTPPDIPLPEATPDPWQNAGALRSWTADPGWVAGRHVYDHGEFVYTDFVYDDTGAGSRLHYPTDWDAYLDNTADIAEVRFARADRATLARVTLNSLAVPRSTVVAVGLGNGDSTRGQPWPHEAGVPVPDGIDTIVTTAGTSGTVTDVGEDRSTSLREAGIDVAVDTDANTIEMRIPDEVFPPDPVFNAVVVSGLWDEPAERWMPVAASFASPDRASGGEQDDPSIFNVAFRPDEDPYARSQEQVRANDAVQAAALDQLDISRFVTTVDRTALERQVSRGHDLATLSGTYIRIYRSRADLGEGVLDLSGQTCNEVKQPSPDRDPIDAPDCIGVWHSRFVPYLIDVPAAYDAVTPVGLIYTGHGAGDNHTQNETNVNRTQSFRDELGTILVGNSGRGKGSLYQRHGELDQLEVLADVARWYAVDAGHVIKLGESMGGIGTWLFGMRTPDLARAIVPLDGVAIWGGHDSTERTIVSEYLGDHHIFDALVPNLTNTPVHAEAAFADPLVRWDLAWEHHVKPLEDLGGRIDHIVCQGTHVTAWALSNRWVDFIEQQLRAPAPPTPSRVRYATDPIQQDLSAPYGLASRQAWWVRELVPDDHGSASVDLTTDTLPSTEPAALVDGDAILPPDPDEDGGTGPCMRTAQAWLSEDRPHTPGKRIGGTVRGVDSMRLDLERLQTSLDGLTLEIDSDGPAGIEVPANAAVELRVDGVRTADIQPELGTVTVPVRSGRHTYRLSVHPSG